MTDVATVDQARARADRIRGHLARLADMGLAGPPPRTSYTPSTSVYLIQQGATGPVKIGMASDPAARLKTMQTGNSEPLRILAVLPGGRKVERDLHQRFAAARLRGEWFRPVPELLALAGAYR